MKYNWEKVPGFEKIYTKVRNNSLILNKDKKAVSRFMSYLEDFMTDCFAKGYITTENFDEVMKRLSRLDAFSYTLNYDTKPGFTSDDRARIYINPNIIPELERLYVYKELSKVVTSLSLAPAKDAMKSRLNAIIRKETEEDKLDLYEYEGWRSLEETISQEIAESLFYIKLNIPRPKMVNKTNEELLGKKITFKSNLKRNMIHQSILIEIVRRLDNNKLANMSDEEVLNFISKRAFKKDFSSDLIKEYIDKYGLDELHYLIGNLGVLSTRENALNEEGIFIDNSITKKKSINSYNNINSVLNPEVTVKRRFF